MVQRILEMEQLAPTHEREEAKTKARTEMTALISCIERLLEEIAPRLTGVLVRRNEPKLRAMLNEFRDPTREIEESEITALADRCIATLNVVLREDIPLWLRRHGSGRF
jgi:hypothetical protein